MPDEIRVLDIFSLEKIGHYFFLKSKDLLLTDKFIRLIFLIFKYYSRFQSFIKKPEIKIDNNGTKRLVNSIFFTQNNKKNVPWRPPFRDTRAGSVSFSQGIG